MVAMLAIIGVTSCEKTPDVIENPSEEGVTISATLENGRDWNAGDEVVINGASYYIEEGGVSTVLVDNVKRADAYYGAYDFGTGTINGTVLTLELPSLQGPEVDMVRPMVASNTTTNLVFKELLGTLRLNVGGEGKIAKVVISSNGTPIAGVGEVDLNFVGSPAFAIDESGSHSITINLGEGVDLPASVDALLPAKSYSGFIVTLYSADDQVVSGIEIPLTNVHRGSVAEANISFDPSVSVETTYLVASLENDADGNATNWAATSVLYVNGVPVEIAGGQDTPTADFGPVAMADTYYASTSSTSVNGVSGHAVRVSIPAKQRVNTSLFTLNPAVGKSTKNEIEMTYLAGVMDVVVEGPYMIRNAVLTGVNNRRLAGSGVVDMSTATPRFALSSDASKSVTLDCGTSGLNIEGGATLRFVLPAEAYTEGFTLTLESTNGESFTQEMGAVTIERNAVATYPETVVWEGGQNDSNNLSKFGFSNCYMIHTAGEYSFQTRLVDNTPVNNIAKVDWLWVSSVEGQSGNALISNIQYENGKVTFTASEYEGNALLAAFDEAGQIVWSWHIWMTDRPEVHDYQNNGIPQSGGATDGYYCMDRNLGATSASSEDGYETFGLYYQWGRKDPFIGDTAEERSRDTQAGGWMNVVEPFGNASTLTVCNPAYSQAKWGVAAADANIGSMAYATANPMTFLSADPSISAGTWINPETMGAEKNNIIYDADKSLWRPFQKSNYDPCPQGYVVPRKAMWVALDSTNSLFVEYKGFMNTTQLGANVWYPAAGYRSAHPSDAGALMSVQNDTGFVKLWTSELEVSYTAYCFTFNYPYYYAGSGAGWANGYNVRCVKAY